MVKSTQGKPGRAKIVYGQATDRGQRRARNEDTIAFEDPLGDGTIGGRGILFLLADGLGGMKHGDVASAMAVEELRKSFQVLGSVPEERWLSFAIQNANLKIYSLNRQATKDNRMATTLTCSYFCEESIRIGHVGDSRLYQIKGRRIFQLTTDHSTDHHRLTRAVGADKALEIEEIYVALQPGDIYVQCSEGLYLIVPEEELVTIVCHYTPSESCERLVSLANENGGADNISVQVIRVEG